MEEIVNCKWTEEMAFEVEVNNHKLMIDAEERVGGKDKGPRPKPLTLASLGGCTGMDVISILNKMKQNVTFFNVKVTGTLTEEHPKYFNKIHITYEFRGEDLKEKKLERAIELSQDRYCGVSYLLRKGSELTYNYVILD